MSEFEFATMPQEYDYFSSPAAETPRKSLSMYEALGSPAMAGDGHSSFEFAECAPRDFFGHVIETKATAKPSAFIASNALIVGAYSPPASEPCMIVRLVKSSWPIRNHMAPTVAAANERPTLSV